MLQLYQTFSRNKKKKKTKRRRSELLVHVVKLRNTKRQAPTQQRSSGRGSYICPRSWPRVFANSGRARIRDTCDAVSSWGIFVPRRKPPLNYPLNTSSGHPAWWSRARRVPRQIHRNLGKISWPVKSGVLSRVTINTARTRVKLPADRPQGSDIRRKPVSGANDMPLAKSCS